MSRMCLNYIVYWSNLGKKEKKSTPKNWDSDKEWNMIKMHLHWSKISKAFARGHDYQDK